MDTKELNDSEQSKRVTDSLKRETTTRLFRFWCWLWYGHDSDTIGCSMNYCSRCGDNWAGPR